VASPFDFSKALTQTKEDLWTHEEVSQREYTPFMINRILSNSERTVFFAEMMNMYPDLDKKMQYYFYQTGIPKNNKYSKMWSKKENSIFDDDFINFIAADMNISIKRAIEVYKLLGHDVIEKQMSLRGGKQANDGKQKN
jgi:hypothetical protein